jgi:uncharacterized protein (DUF1800 family)
MMTLRWTLIFSLGLFSVTEAGSAPLAVTAPQTGFSAAAGTTIQLKDAVRFLSQSAWGATKADTDAVRALGYDGWISDQFNTASIDTHVAYVQRMGPIGCNPCDSTGINAFMESFWRQAVLGQDQLRQRTAWALSQIFVTSQVNSGLDDPLAHASYYDMLSSNAFGNYRQLLEGVALHPTMGIYLSHLGNIRENTATGQLPDENFAREVMQLMSIGLWQLNPDGSRKKDANNKDIPTYNQTDILNMARVFTGWSWGGPDTTDNRWYGQPKAGVPTINYLLPMQNYARYTSGRAKNLVTGVVIPAQTDGPTSMKIALDTLFNHPNVPPFIGSQLIKRLVTSNPSPAYINRVSQAFINNGAGVRGDMKAVLRAVLLDPEARTVSTSPTYGKLREPVLRYGYFLRTYSAVSDSSKYRIWNLQDPVWGIGQNPQRSPSVFNFYRPDYAPTGPIRNAGLTAPEFQITLETTTTGYANFILGAVDRTNPWVKKDVKKNGPVDDYLAGNFATELGLANANDTAGLVDRVNTWIAAGQMSTSTRNAITAAVNSIGLGEYRGAERKVTTAVGLALVSTDFLVQK